MSSEPIAYTYEAAEHCPSCAEKRFGKDEYGIIGVQARDREGNEPGAIAPWDEWHVCGEQDSGLGKRCDCADPGCKQGHGSEECNQTPIVVLTRADYDPAPYFSMCDECSDDAWESGMFSEARCVGVLACGTCGEIIEECGA